MPPRCATCRWWDAPESPEEDDAGRCVRIGSLSWWGPDADERKTALAYFPADLDSGMMRTRPDFGCVQWAAKDISYAEHVEIGGSVRKANG